MLQNSIETALLYSFLYKRSRKDYSKHIASTLKVAEHSRRRLLSGKQHCRYRGWSACGLVKHLLHFACNRLLSSIDVLAINLSEGDFRRILFFLGRGIVDCCAHRILGTFTPFPWSIVSAAISGMSIFLAVTPCRVGRLVRQSVTYRGSLPQLEPQSEDKSQ